MMVVLHGSLIGSINREKKGLATFDILSWHNRYHSLTGQHIVTVNCNCASFQLSIILYIAYHSAFGPLGPWCPEPIPHYPQLS